VKYGNVIGLKVLPLPHSPLPSLPSLPLTFSLFIETGTICSLVYDIPNRKISTLLAFSQGHWENPKEAHGDKRNRVDFERWRGLAGIGRQTDRFLLNEQAELVEVFKAKGGLESIDEGMETM
jgi:hypothetical protein